jgi:hypothetical protein
MNDKLLEGLKLGHLRKELKAVRKEYYKPLSKMSRVELLAEHSRHSGLMKGDTTAPEKKVEEVVLEKKTPSPMVYAKKTKVVPGLPQAMSTSVGAATREGGKALGEPTGKPKKTKEHLVPAAAPPAASSGKKSSPYNTFVAQHRRAGKSMAEIGAMWKGMK